MVCSNMPKPREKLHKLVLPKEIQQSANRIMSCYIRGKNTILGNRDEVYAVGKAIEKKIVIYPNEKKEIYKQRIEKQEQKGKKVKG